MERKTAKQRTEDANKAMIDGLSDWMDGLISHSEFLALERENEDDIDQNHTVDALKPTCDWL